MSHTVAQSRGPSRLPALPRQAEMRLTVVNPNTSAAFRDTLQRQLAPIAAPGTDLRVVSPRVGFPAIEGYRDDAYASAGLCEVVARAQAEGAEGFLIACFGDTGLFAAREIATGPVVGMTEAGLQAASTLAHRFAIVTLPRRTLAHSERVVAHLGLAHRCSVRAIDISVGALEAETEVAFPAVLAEARIAAREDHAEAIILGCAGMAALTARLQDSLQMPVIDGASVGLKMLEGLVSCGLGTSKVSSFASPVDHGTPPPHLSAGQERT